jgi:UDP-N-acetylglucosamine--N-acetylmuramyl-(pentapeptide) pyrophosphoryl-undecaprenol N-acetylglucosamine transferase
VIPGRANKLLARFVDRIAISFADSEGYFKAHKNKVILTGNPLRKEILKIDKDKALDFFGLDHRRLTVLVMGGSQGSSRINRAFVKAAARINDKSRFQVIHLAGSKDLNFLEEEYRNSGISVKLFAFLEPIAYAYSASDLIISRGGATSISEITFFKLPAIIIPYPYAYRHQMMNACVLERNASALIIEDTELYTDKLLKEILESLLEHPDKLQGMASNYPQRLSSCPNDLLSEAVISLTGGPGGNV